MLYGNIMTKFISNNVFMLNGNKMAKLNFLFTVWRVQTNYSIKLKDLYFFHERIIQRDELCEAQGVITTMHEESNNDIWDESSGFCVI